jgi:hypothetical protein
MLEKQTNTKKRIFFIKLLNHFLTAKYNVLSVLAAIRVKFVIFPLRIRIITRATLKY